MSPPLPPAHADFEGFANALAAAFNLEALRALLFYRLRKDPEAYFSENDSKPAAILKVIQAAIREKWIAALAREAFAFRPEDLQLKAYAATDLTQDSSPLLPEPFPEAPPPDGAGIPWTMLANSIFGTGRDEETDRVRRGFKNDSYKMAFDQLPITGDRLSTQKISLASLDIAYAQGQKSVVKLIRFVVPNGARQLRVPSNRRLDEPGIPFTPPSWVFLSDDSGINERPKSSSTALLSEDRWILSSADEGKVLYSVTYYENNHFFPFPGRGDNTGAVIGDLAGRIERLNVQIGGCFSDLTFGGYYSFYPVSPLTFYPLNLSRVLDIADPARHRKETFGTFIQRLRERPEGGGERPEPLRAAADLWSELDVGEFGWIGATLTDVRQDIMIHITGSYTGH